MRNLNGRTNAGAVDDAGARAEGKSIMVSGPALGIALAVALSYLVGVEVIHGAKWIGHQVKRGGTAIVHVLKKIPHPHSKDPQ